MAEYVTSEDLLLVLKMLSKHFQSSALGPKLAYA